MIEIAERITRLTTSRASNLALRAERVPTGVRVTLEFNRSVPLSPGQEVRWRYDSGDGHFLDCVGIPQPTHVVARRGHLVVFHYRLSQWIANRKARMRISTAVLAEPAGEVPAVDQSPA